MKICILTEGYPNSCSQSDFAFVKQLVDAMASKGNDCYVMVPFSVTHYKKIIPVKDSYWVGDRIVRIFRPRYISLSNKTSFSRRLAARNFSSAMGRAIRKMDVLPDVMYGHFWRNAYLGFSFANKNNIPLFVATGESQIKKMFPLGPRLKEFTDYVSGVVCVSTKNRDESIALGLTSTSKCIVLPNAINACLFKKMDKKWCREQLRLPQKVFIAIFVGWFNERKGPKRVSEAIKQIPGGNVYSLFVGKGEQGPDCDNILFKGSLPHDRVPLFLNAADVFVLPSLNEGCCNAVVEAMACGLPVISSNLSFNWDVLDKTNSILIDPNNIDAIADAIRYLRDDVDFRKILSEGALNKAKSLTIDNRVDAILNFIDQKLK